MRNKKCCWYPGNQHDDNPTLFRTECGGPLFEFNDGGWEDNGFKYCPYCRGKLVNYMTEKSLLDSEEE